MAESIKFSEIYWSIDRKNKFGTINNELLMKKENVLSKMNGINTIKLPIGYKHRNLPPPLFPPGEP